MQKIASLVCLSLLLTGLGCAHALIFPMEGNRYRVVASSSSEFRSYRKAVDEMTSHCEDRGQSFEVIEESSEYHGVDKSVKAMAGVAESALEALAQEKGSHTTPSYNHSDTSEDNRVTMTFRCK